MKRYNTPHRSRVVKTRMTEEEYAEFAQRLSAYHMSHKARNAGPRGFEGRRSLYGRPHGEGPRGVVRGAAPFARTADGPCP